MDINTEITEEVDTSITLKYDEDAVSVSPDNNGGNKSKQKWFRNDINEQDLLVNIIIYLASF